MNSIRFNHISAFVLFATVVLVIGSFWAEHNVGPNLLPHGFCFTWIPTLLWLHVVSDALIGLAYISIPLTLLYFVRRRADLPFHWMFLLFALFIVSCGFTHWMAIWTIWNPDYWLDGALKAVTASASILTAAALVYLVPRALAIPTVRQLQEAKEALETQVRVRETVEAELREARDALERRVEERTRELSEAKVAAERARAEAETANQMKDKFLAKVSHELRTPLQSTMSWAQVLSRTSHNPEGMRLALDRLQHNVKAQARLIDDLLDISRILSGKLRLDWDEVELGPLLNKAVDMVKPNAVERDVEVRLEVDRPDVKFRTDPARFEQVIWNLVNNAVQSSERGGHVRVRVHVGGPRLRIEVSDQGKGISPADLPLIFEPFHQSQGAVNQHRGLGLGLAISRSIVTQLGGSVRADSEGLGHGATFSVALPMLYVGAKSREHAVALNSHQRERLRGLRVLYVEDEMDIAESTRVLLSDFGLAMTVCHEYQCAIEHIERGDFDVLLSDINLGGPHGGLHLVRALRASPRTQGVPAVAVSAYGGEDDRRASVQAGFAVHLVKPVGPSDIAHALTMALERAA
ncbi:MAG TPA: hybrid sensor histidine kinase/response regulator [Burkholderiaceae bacterium]|nr:hybrid sensor histidine kinase/response regulator [Burkholderiaceae bacterium]